MLIQHLSSVKHPIVVTDCPHTHSVTFSQWQVTFRGPISTRYFLSNEIETERDFVFIKECRFSRGNYRQFQAGASDFSPLNVQTCFLAHPRYPNGFFFFI
jgi:hypothetical protein